MLRGTDSRTSCSRNSTLLTSSLHSSRVFVPQLAMLMMASLASWATFLPSGEFSFESRLMIVVHRSCICSCTAARTPCSVRGRNPSVSILEGSSLVPATVAASGGAGLQIQAPGRSAVSVGYVGEQCNRPSHGRGIVQKGFWRSFRRGRSKLSPAIKSKASCRRSSGTPRCSESQCPRHKGRRCRTQEGLCQCPTVLHAPAGQHRAA